MEEEMMMKDFSIEGLQKIGQGLTASVYRINEEQIIKVYVPEYGLDRILKEKDVTRQSFISGVPTMMTFGTVCVGDSYGTIFEAFNYETLQECYQKQHANRDSLVDEYVDFVKQISAVQVNDELRDMLPSMLERLKNVFNKERYRLSDEESQIYEELISRIEHTDTFVHGDCHMGNLMYGPHQKLYAIDLGVCGYGSKLFVLCSIALSYSVGAKSLPGEQLYEVTGLSREECKELWHSFLCKYYGINGDEIIPYERSLYMYACMISSLYGIETGKIPEEVFRNVMVRGVVDTYKDGILPMSKLLS